MNLHRSYVVCSQFVQEGAIRKLAASRLGESISGINSSFRHLHEQNGEHLTDGISNVVIYIKSAVSCAEQNDFLLNFGY